MQDDAVHNLALSESNYRLALNSVVFDAELEALLEGAKNLNGRWNVAISYDQLDDLLNAVAATANHEPDPKLEQSYDDLFGLLKETLGALG